MVESLDQDRTDQSLLKYSPFNQDASKILLHSTLQSKSRYTNSPDNCKLSQSSRLRSSNAFSGLKEESMLTDNLTLSDEEGDSQRYTLETLQSPYTKIGTFIESEVRDGAGEEIKLMSELQMEDSDDDDDEFDLKTS